MELKKCPKCKKHYNEYPAISRADDCTPICPICGETEALYQYVNYSVTLRADRLTELEKAIRKKVVKMHLDFSKIRKQQMREQNAERSRMGQKMKKLYESS